MYKFFYDKSFIGALRFTFAFILRIIIVFAPLVFFLLYLNHGSSLFSLGPANDQIYIWGFALGMLTLIVLSSYFTHGHYSDISGLGKTYDLQRLIKSKFALFVTKDGLRGATKVQWKSIRSVESHADQEAILYLKRRLLLPLPSDGYRIKFSSQEELNRFLDVTHETLSK